MTEAGWVGVWAWCESLGGRLGAVAVAVAEVAVVVVDVVAGVFGVAGAKVEAEAEAAEALAGKGVISTLNADGGTWACCRIFKTAGGKAGACVPTLGPALGPAVHAVLAEPIRMANPARRTHPKLRATAKGAKRRAQPLCWRKKNKERCTQFKLIRRV